MRYIVRPLAQLRSLSKLDDRYQLVLTGSNKLYGKLDKCVGHKVVLIDGIGNYKIWNGIINTNGIFQFMVPFRNSTIIKEETLLKTSSMSSLQACKYIFNIQDHDITWKSRNLD